jgi:inner membrane protein
MASKILSSYPVAGKVCAIGLVVLVLMIPLSMLRGLIGERTQMRAQAYDTVARGWGGRLTTGGPMLRIPYDVSNKDKDGVITVTRHQLYVLANNLSVDANMQQEAEPRHVGIYQVPVYQVQLAVLGNFNGSALTQAAAATVATYRWSEARLRIPLSDVRSVRELANARFGNAVLKFGPGESGTYTAIEANVDLTNQLNQDTIGFGFDMKLAGSQALSLLPLAATTNVKLRSTWPHPQFEGAFLPAERTINNQGFNASWQVLELNRSFRQSWRDETVNDEQLQSAAFGVELFQSVDVYQRSERAVKYALMFIALTFLSFYAWELLSGAAIHPMQYLLVGMALSTFYLLLIALTEHLAFWRAYWLGAGALVALLGTYIAGAMRSTAPAI